MIGDGARELGIQYQTANKVYAIIYDKSAFAYVHLLIERIVTSRPLYDRPTLAGALQPREHHRSLMRELVVCVYLHINDRVYNHHRARQSGSEMAPMRRPCSCIGNCTHGVSIRPARIVWTKFRAAVESVLFRIRFAVPASSK